MSSDGHTTRSDELSAFVEETARAYGIPGVAVGVLVDGRESSATFGVTNVDNPQPVDERTLFHLASVTKSFTATLAVRLAAEGRLDLDAPVRRYVPELRLPDEQAAATVTVRNLLNHTAGLDWNLVFSGDEGDTLAGFVAEMARIPLIAPVGARASYSQAGFNLLGRVLEAAAGLPFEKAAYTLLLEPLGLSDTHFDFDEIMVRRYAVGHVDDGEGGLRPARPWFSWRAGTRGNNPGGGISSSVADLLRWARFQLGDGQGVLPAEALHGMKERSSELRGSSLGDGFGLGWFLRGVDGVRTVGHGGSGNGQFSELLLVPERDFAVVSLTNGDPDGYLFNQAVVRWALEHHLGLVDKDPEPVPYDEARAREVVGRYEIDAMNLDLATDGEKLTLAVEIKPEIRRASEADMPPDIPPAAVGFLAGTGDDYILTEGGLAGQRGYFSRDAAGRITGVDLAGRLFGRVPAV